MKPTSGNALKIPKWVPMPAQQKLRELMSAPTLTKNQRALLDRLAIRDEMKTDVWEKLPSEFVGKEDQIIAWVSYAYLAYLMEAPIKLFKGETPEKLQAWSAYAHRQKFIRTPGNIARLAHQMLEDMLDASIYAASKFNSRGADIVNYYDAIEIIGQVGIFFDALEKERQNVLTRLPPVGSRISEKGHRVYFTDRLSWFFNEQFGQPPFAVIASLEQVAFDVLDGTSEDVVRGRWKRAMKQMDKSRPKA